MKKCPYCGTRYPDESNECCLDQEQLLPDAPHQKPAAPTTLPGCRAFLLDFLSGESQSRDRTVACFFVSLGLALGLVILVGVFEIRGIPALLLLALSAYFAFVSQSQGRKLKCR
jgi:hypothetical protein